MKNMIAVFFLLLSATSVTYADLTIQSTVTFDDPQLRNLIPKLKPQQKQQLKSDPLLYNGILQTTFYVSGPKLRIDIKDTSIVMDARLKTSLAYSHKKLIPAISPFFLTQPYPDKEKLSTATIPVTIQSTGEVKTILNRKAQKYIISGEIVDDSHISGTVWCVNDVQHYTDNIDDFLTANIHPVFLSVWNQVTGLPVIFDITFTAKTGSQVKYTYKVNSLATSKIPASTFLVPPGYLRGN